MEKRLICQQGVSQYEKDTIRNTIITKLSWNMMLFYTVPQISGVFVDCYSHNDSSKSKTIL